MTNLSGTHIGAPVANGDGIEFYDLASKRTMKYIYSHSTYYAAGWLLYRHLDGYWVLLRQATEADILAINEAVAQSHPHHRPAHRSTE